MTTGTIDSHSEIPSLANLGSTFEARRQLRAWAKDKPEPTRNLVHVICCQLWELSQCPDSVPIRTTLAENIERLRRGEGMH